MTFVERLCGVSIIASLAATAAVAADLASPPAPPPPPSFYVHAGVQGEFLQTDAQLVAGTGLIPFSVANVVARPLYTLAIEGGYFITPNMAIALSLGAPPPLVNFKATGFAGTPFLGTNLLGSVRAGSIRGLVQYHFTEFGALQPYVGAGVSYALNLGNINDGIIRSFGLDQNFSFILQAGADWMFTPNWGVFVDGKKAFFATDAQGFLLTTSIPVRAHINFDPWIASTGITFKY